MHVTDTTGFPPDVHSILPRVYPTRAGSLQRYFVSAQSYSTLTGVIQWEWCFGKGWAGTGDAPAAK